LRLSRNPFAQQQEPSAPDGQALERVKAQWSEIRQAVGRRAKRFEAMLSPAMPAVMDGNTLVIAHPHAPIAGRLAEPAARDAMRAALSDVLQVDWDVRVEAGAAPAATAAAPARQVKPQRQQTFTRPSRPDAPPPEPEAEPDLPEPPVPDEELTDSEVGEMIAGAKESSPDPRTDPDQVAMELLANELGAKPID
jgi:DNA polymerase-3 subunit gamma/tau